MTSFQEEPTQRSDKSAINRSQIFDLSLRFCVVISLKICVFSTSLSLTMLPHAGCPLRGKKGTVGFFSSSLAFPQRSSPAPSGDLVKLGAGELAASNGELDQASVSSRPRVLYLGCSSPDTRELDQASVSPRPREQVSKIWTPALSYGVTT
jgi:hypothetical protein